MIITKLFQRMLFIKKKHRRRHRNTVLILFHEAFPAILCLFLAASHSHVYCVNSPNEIYFKK